MIGATYAQTSSNPIDFCFRIGWKMYSERFRTLLTPASATRRLALDNARIEIGHPLTIHPNEGDKKLQMKVDWV